MTGVAAVALRVTMACDRHVPYHCELLPGPDGTGVYPYKPPVEPVAMGTVRIPKLMGVASPSRLGRKISLSGQHFVLSPTCY